LENWIEAIEIQAGWAMAAKVHELPTPTYFSEEFVKSRSSGFIDGQAEYLLKTLKTAIEVNYPEKKVS